MPISRRALGLFAARTYVPAPLSIYERLFKLPAGVHPDRHPGSRVLAALGGAGRRTSEGGISLKRYWSYREVVLGGLADPIEEEGEALERLERVLADAIKGQSVADVPVGAFLSGGIDSSTVVALYQKYSPIPVRTFTIGFEEAGFNEAEHAKAVAAISAPIHSERYVTVEEARDVIPLLPAMYDEPFADSSQIPTHLVSRFAREQVKVALSGDGGDELFAGYNRHFMAPRLWQRLRMLPRAARALIGGPLSKFPSGTCGAPCRAAARQTSAPRCKRRCASPARRARSTMSTSFLDEWAVEPSPVLGGGTGGGRIASTWISARARRMRCG